MSRSLFARLDRRFGPSRPALSRRELLKAAAAAAGTLLVSRSVRAEDGPGTGRTVAVVGAGFAGLTAAHELSAAGYDVQVYETRSRAGGRVLSFGDLLDGRTIEGGGEFIGKNHPLWLSLARQFDLPLDEPPESDADLPIVLRGERLNERAAESLWQEMDEALSTLTDDAKTIDAEQPWKSPRAAELDRRAVADWIDKLKASVVCKLAIQSQLAADNGVIPAWQSYLGLLAMIKGGGLEKFWTESETYRCRGGNQRLCDKLIAKIGAERVHFDKAITRIVVTERKVMLALHTGLTMLVDDLVLAAPPSVWNKIAFEPALPAALAVQMANNIKYLSIVKSRFWEAEKHSAEALTDGPAQLTWEATAGQKGPEACLTAFSGAAASDVCRSWPSAERDARYATALEKTHAGFSKAFIKSRFMDWPADVWTKGSYSFPAPGQVTAAGPILHAGLGRLHFAGEHACPAFVGYMEGALQSGAAVARRLAKRDGGVNPALGG